MEISATFEGTLAIYIISFQSRNFCYTSFMEKYMHICSWKHKDEALLYSKYLWWKCSNNQNVEQWEWQTKTWSIYTIENYTTILNNHLECMGIEKAPWHVAASTEYNSYIRTLFTSKKNRAQTLHVSPWIQILTSSFAASATARSRLTQFSHK